jgi:hypothetical protein
VLALVVAALTTTRSLITASTSVSFISLPACGFGFRYSHLPSPYGYADQDGEADDDTLAEHTDRLPKVLALLFIAIDLAIGALRLLGITAPGLALLDSVARVRRI